jgi:hypothetical protein
MSSSGGLTGILPNLPLIFFPQSDNFPSITVVRGSDGLTPVTDCTGTCTLFDEYGQGVPGATSVTMTGSGNVYTAQFAASGFNPIPGRNYRLQIVLTSSSLAAKRTWWADAWVAEENMA